MWIVELEAGVYLAPWEGDPGRTTNIEVAMRHKTERGAKIALGKARYYRPFKGARVIELASKEKVQQTIALTELAMKLERQVNRRDIDE